MTASRYDRIKRIRGRRFAETLRSLRMWWLVFYLRRCLAGFPWFWPARPRGQHAMVEARRIVRRHFGRDHHPVLRKLAQLLVTIAWPPAILINLWYVWHDLGLGPVELMHARRRVPKALWVAIRHNIAPTEYYAYGLWLPDRKANIDNYLYSNECARLFKALNQPRDPDPIEDKLIFHGVCKVHAIPTPQILAAFTPTGKLFDFEDGRPPQHDLFVKGSTGSGLAERLRWHGIDFESHRGCRLKPEDLGTYLVDRARTWNLTVLVQPVLSNHKDLGVEPNGALATARLITGRSPDGEVTPILSFIYFGLPGEITSASNHVTLIDVANGRLMPAPPQDAPGVSMYRYRQFGSSDAIRLPDWDAALRHVKVAHEACSNFVFVGWDVAFTPRGAMVLEGNANWEAATYQTLRGEPISCTKFNAILAAQLRDRPSGKFRLG